MDRYRVLHPMEPGPNVSVYLVEDLWIGRQRQVLTLLPYHVTKEQDRLELEEIFSWRHALDHELLVCVEDLAFRGNKVGFLSEFIHGLPLNNSFFHISKDQLLSRAMQLAELLVYLHHRGFNCGVITPSQLFFSSDNRLKANFLIPNAKQTSEKAVNSWIKYAAPELLAGGNCSFKSDLYSLGMVLYYLFTGQEPYNDHNSDYLKQKQLLVRPTRPRKLNPNIPDRLEQLIEDLIEKEPVNRPGFPGDRFS